MTTATSLTNTNRCKVLHRNAPTYICSHCVEQPQFQIITAAFRPQLLPNVTILQNFFFVTLPPCTPWTIVPVSRLATVKQWAFILCPF